MRVVAAILTILAVVAAEVTFKQKCDGVSEDLCTVDEVRITPCKKSPCPLKRGHNASMEFEYTPNFAADSMTTAVYWADDPTQTPFSSVGVIDACPLTTCPAVAGTQRTLNFNFYLGKKLPNGIFAFRWKLWNTNNKDQLCCFETKIKLY